jgi:hypothetical protein
MAHIEPQGAQVECLIIVTQRRTFSAQALEPPPIGVTDQATASSANVCFRPRSISHGLAVDENNDEDHVHRVKKDKGPLGWCVIL